MSDQSNRPRVPGLRRLLLSLVALVVIGATAAAAYFTPVLSVRTISVHGAANVPTEDVQNVVEPLRGTPLLQVGSGQRAAYAQQVVGLSDWVDSATVSVEYPSTLVVTVTEREVVAYSDTDGIALVDTKGVPFLRVPEPPILTPRLTVPSPSPTDPNTRAAIAVLRSLPPDVHGQVIEIGADSPANVRFVLRDNRVVLWGDDSQAAEKAAALAVVLTRPGREFTVIDPQVPTAR